MQDERPFLRNRHLRLTVQIHKDKATVLEMDVIDEPLVEPGRVAGPFIVGVAFGGGPSWIDTMQDPFVRRGVPRAGEREHYYETLDSATVVVRVPIPSDSVPDDFRVEFYRASGPLPEKVRDLEKLLRFPQPGNFEHISAVGLFTLQKHPDWRKITKQAWLKP